VPLLSATPSLSLTVTAGVIALPLKSKAAALSVTVLMPAKGMGALSILPE